ncbi:MAG: hypothetical protein NT123_06900 [Proteobacteria bacterium]|nr:hypothetical protein [Pseudomonadota bacterium]
MSFEAIPNLLADMLQEQKNTTEAITKLMETLAGLRTKFDGAAKAAKTVIATAAAPTADVPAATTLPIEAPAAAPAAAQASTAQLDYKADIAPTFAKLLSAKGAPAVVAVLSTFGVKKGIELAPAQLPAALASALAALDA